MPAKSEGGRTPRVQDLPVGTTRLARRRLLAQGGSLLAGAAILGGAVEAKMPAGEVAAAGGDLWNEQMPGLEFVLEAHVTVAPGIELGQGVEGRRRIVPITGGTFRGPRLSGSVLEEGEDTQVLRRDGVREIAARYVLRTHDGVLLYVINTGLIAPGDAQAPARLYKRTTPRFDAPVDSAYSWLNRSLFVGTLQRSPVPEHGVIVRFFRVT